MFSTGQRDNDDDKSVEDGEDAGTSDDDDDSQIGGKVHGRMSETSVEVNGQTKLKKKGSWFCCC